MTRKKPEIIQRDGQRYGRPNLIVALYDFPRYRLFECIKKGDFKSVLIKRPGAKRGLRLIEIASFEKYLAKFETNMASGTQNTSENN